MEEDAIFTFDSPKGQSSYIKVIGVGGGGGNAVNHMFRQGIEGVDFIVCNTDMKALNASPVPNKIPLGTLGLGAGNKPERARMAAEAKADDIREAISHNTQMLFITAGMGGGTGTGAAPVIAEIAKSIDLDNDENKKILVVAIVTRPFSFEGKRRKEQAEAGIAELRKHVDSIIVINNDKLRSFGNMRISEAFGMADDVLLTAAKGIAEIITESAYVNRDFQDVNTVMEHSGTALMGTGSGTGENRAHDAIEAATTSVLLDDSDISGAKNVLLYFSYSSEHEMTMDEQAEITDFVLDRTNGTADIIWGAGPDDTLGDELKVILIATGFEKTSTAEEPKTFVLPKEEPELKETAKPAAAQPLPDEPILITKSEPAPETLTSDPVVAVGIAAKASDSPTAEKRIFTLDDDEPAPAPVAAKHEEPAEQVDALVEDIHIVGTLEPEPEPEPVIMFEPAAPVAEAQPAVAPQPVTVAEPVAEEPVVRRSPSIEQIARSAFENENDVKTTAERIRYIHDLLRNNANGAEMVQNMSTSEIAAGELYEGRHSSARESSSYTMRADGTMARNAYFGDQPD